MGKELKVYLAGPSPDFTHEDYLEAATIWDACGWRVVEPATLVDTEPYEAYLRRDLDGILQTDALALLPGWEQSSGACVEALIAASLGIPLMDAQTGQSIAADLICNRQVARR